MASKQESFFPEPAPKPVDTEAIAAGGRAYDPEDRTSDAARDQGWGPVDLPHTETTAKKPAKLYELPGKDGRNNTYNQPVTPQDAQRGMTDATIDEQRSVNHAGAESVIQNLRNITPPPAV